MKNYLAFAVITDLAIMFASSLASCLSEANSVSVIPTSSTFSIKRSQ